MIEWHKGKPPKFGRFLLVARATNAGPEQHGWDVVVGHWHQARHAFVAVDVPLDIRKGARPELEVSHWALIETPVKLRPLANEDTHG